VSTSIPELLSDGRLAYSIRNAARSLDVSTSWLFAEIRAGKIGVSKTPRGKILVPHTELVAYLERHFDNSGAPTRPVSPLIQKRQEQVRAREREQAETARRQTAARKRAGALA
jgi:hypothetical protein